MQRDAAAQPEGPDDNVDTMIIDEAHNGRFIDPIRLLILGTVFR